jgi:hypothetical protein
MIRPLFTEREYIESVVAATEIFKEWDTIVGGDAGYRQPGFMRIVSEWTVEQLGVDLDILDHLGVRHERIPHDDLDRSRGFTLGAWSGVMTYRSRSILLM